MSEHAKSKLQSILAKDIMTEDVVVINQKMLIGQVAHLMLRERVSGYPIVDESGKVCGIVTLSDLFVLINNLFKQTQGMDISVLISECKNRPIAEIMSKNVKTILQTTPLTEIIEDVVKLNIHTFPVMDNDKLVGIIGRHDVLNATFVYG